MKVACICLALLGCCLASPALESIDTFDIRPIDILHAPTLRDEPLVPGGRVIGGTVAPRNSIPYQAALIINNSGFCGGSLISTTVVLTAAHCVDNAIQTQVILGAHSPLTSEPTQRVEVSTNHVIHPRWISLLLQNDIALVRLSPVTLTNEIQLVPLAPADSPTFAGSAAVLSGWGRTSDASNSIASELNRVDLLIISNEVCRNTFSAIVQPQHICTSGQGVVGGCNGDSGGPLTVNGLQVGIVSFGSALCEAQNPTAYARVSHFIDWIQEASVVRV